MSSRVGRCLLTRAQVLTLLQLDEPALARLVSTSQLQELRVCGHVRFDSKDIYTLIDIYKAVAKRRNNE